MNSALALDMQFPKESSIPAKRGLPALCFARVPGVRAQCEFTAFVSFLVT